MYLKALCIVMTELMANISVTSVQDGTINNSRITALSQETDNGGPNLKRTFSIRKCYASNRVSKRKLKYKDCGVVERPNVNCGEVGSSKKLKLLNSSSLNKLIHKVVRKMTNFSLNGKHAVYSSHENSDSNSNQNILSLSTSEIYDNDVRVPPIRPSFVKSDKVPGVIGLRNHGNTCFINAILQCLSHTDILAEYFVLDQYKIDLSRRNKLNSKKYGTKGEITEQLAVLLKSIWSCQYNPEISNHFKVVVDKYGSQYRGNNQHDAQEFLLWLLDKVHEDLNIATKKKYKTIKVNVSVFITLGTVPTTVFSPSSGTNFVDSRTSITYFHFIGQNSFGKPEAVAAETLANHVRCNNSFVHAVFQAQFCSSVTCPRCDRQSNTFDPFLCVSVPVPQNHVGIYVTVLYTSQQPRQVSVGEFIPLNYNYVRSWLWVCAALYNTYTWYWYALGS